MAELKTKPNNEDVGAFIESITDESRRADAKTLSQLFEKITGEPPVMWGSSIVGFGKYHYRYASGREGDWMLTGFSPRKQALTLYIMSGFSKMDLLREQLGKHSTGKSCLYVKKLEDVDLKVLEEMIRRSARHTQSTNEKC